MTLLVYLFCVATSGGGGVSMTTSLWRSEDNLWIWALALLHVGARDRTQVVKFDRRHLYQLSHVTGPDWIYTFFNCKTRKIIFAELIYHWRGLPTVIFRKSALSFFRKIIFSVFTYLKLNSEKSRCSSQFFLKRWGWIFLGIFPSKQSTLNSIFVW